MAIVINPATYAPKTWGWDRVKTTSGIYLFDGHPTLEKYLVLVPFNPGMGDNKATLICIPNMGGAHSLEATHSLDPYKFHPYQWDTTNLWKYLHGSISVEAFRETLTRMK